MDLRPTGVWVLTDGMTAVQTAKFAQRIEELGYSALWFPEILGRHSFVQASWLLSTTDQLVVASGIANIFLRDAYATATAQRTLAEQSCGRFLLGLGISQVEMVENVLKRAYAKPVAAMRTYLETMERAVYAAPPPKEEPPIVLAALGPKLLALAAEKTRGSHSYLVPPEHTATAREVLGKEPWLCVEQKVLLERNPSKAREIARKATAFYLNLKSYQRSLKRLGYGDNDLAAGGSDRLIDALVAWGDEKTIERRIQAHRDAGASHVCIQPINPDGSLLPDIRVVEAMAPAFSSEEAHG